MNTKSIPVIGALIERLKKRSDHEIVAAATVSKGDVTRVQGYEQLKKCLDQLGVLNGGSGSLGRPYKAARDAHAALLKHRPAFQAAHGASGSEAVRLVYAQAVACLWHGVSMICAEAVRFDPRPGGVGYVAVVVPEGVTSLSSTVPVTRLEQFAGAAGKYGFKEVVQESAAVVEREATLQEDMGLTTAIAGGVALFGLLVYLARDLAEYFYNLRGSLAKWLDMQVSFLEMNASGLGPAQAGARAKQEEYARRFRALADRIRVESADAERESRREIDRPVAQAAVAPGGRADFSAASSGALI